MPTKMMPSSGKPPLPRSPIRLRPRRALKSNANTVQTPPGSLAKNKFPKSDWDSEELDVHPEYRTISCESMALAKMVHQEFGNGEMGDICNGNGSSLFERGRFYEEYSARRNERLKRKKGEIWDDKKPVYYLGVRVEPAKRRESKRFESLRKTVPSTPITERRQASSSRYLLRSTTSKENKKPHLAMNVGMSVGVGEKKIGVGRARKN